MFGHIAKQCLNIIAKNILLNFTHQVMFCGMAEREAFLGKQNLTDMSGVGIIQI